MQWNLLLIKKKSCTGAKGFHLYRLSPMPVFVAKLTKTQHISHKLCENYQPHTNAYPKHHICSSKQRVSTSKASPGRHQVMKTMSSLIESTSHRVFLLTTDLWCVVLFLARQSVCQLSGKSWTVYLLLARPNVLGIFMHVRRLYFRDKLIYSAVSI